VTPSTISATESPKRREFFFGDRRVFDHVVQDRRDQSVGVESQAGENFGGGDGMGDVGFAGFALLAFVRLCAELGRVTYAFDLIGRQVAADDAEQIFETGCTARAGQQAEQGLRVIHLQPPETRLGVSLRGRTAAHGSPDRAR